MSLTIITSEQQQDTDSLNGQAVPNQVNEPNQIIEDTSDEQVSTEETPVADDQLNHEGTTTFTPNTNENNTQEVLELEDNHSVVTIIEDPTIDPVLQSNTTKQTTITPKKELDIGTKTDTATPRYQLGELGFKIYTTEKNKIDFKPGKALLTIEKTPKTTADKIIIEQHNRVEINWTLTIAMISLILLLIIKRFFKDSFSSLYKSLVNYQLSEKLLRDKNILTIRSNLILNVHFILIFSLLLAVVLWKYGSTEKLSISSFLFFMSILASIIIARYLIINIIGYTFDKSKLAKEQIFNIQLIDKALGITILPFVFMILYAPKLFSTIAMGICIALVILAFIIRLLRIIQTNNKNDVLLFHSFLYLCTLELLPLIIGIKFIISLT